MKIKEKPEDFQVIEIPQIKLEDKGQYAVYKLKKINKNTEDAIQIIRKKLNIPRKNISYAGTKDKIAITEQYITIKTNKETKFEHENIKLEYLGRSQEPISLGMLKGNKFKITIRNLNGNEKINETKKIINYFHKQRFSKNNAEIGKHLIKKEYAQAINYLKEDKTYGEKIKQHLQKSKNDYVGALKTIPKKILTLYAHAYQSKIWNKTVKELHKKQKLPKEIPIPGFSDYKTDDETKKEIEKILQEEQITQKDFLNKDIPSLCIEGTTRKTITEAKNLKIQEYEKDEIHENKKKLTITFELGKGEYATNVIEQIIQ